jgi:hypothetical protein
MFSVPSVISAVKRYFDRLTAFLPFCLTAENTESTEIHGEIGNKNRIKYSPCISVFSVVKRYFDRFLFNRRGHGEHRDTQRDKVIYHFTFSLEKNLS